MGKKSNKRKAGAAKANKKPHHRPKDDRDEAAASERDPSELPSYERYKAATQRFKRTLRSLVPQSIFERDSVQDFVIAVDFVADNKLAVKTDVLLADLRLAIAVRKRYSKHFVNGGDDGHAYFITVLNYCLHTLKSCCNSATVDTRESDYVHQHQKSEDDDDLLDVHNRFASLHIDLDEIEDKDDEDDNEEPVVRPEEPSKHYSSAACLMSVPDTAQAMQFFDIIDIQMRYMTFFLTNIKETMQMIDRGELSPDHNVAKELMAFGTTFNLAMKTIKHHEDSLTVQNPHLNTCYRIIACAFLSPCINIVKNGIRDYSPVPHKFKDHMANTFVADLVEIVFRGSDSCFAEIDQKAIEFSKRWKLSQHWTDKQRWLANMTAKIILRETITLAETQIYDQEYLRLGDDFEYTESWLEDMSCIGGDRSMIRTLKILDAFAKALNAPEDDVSEAVMFRALQGGCFSENYDENDKPVNKIQYDLDGFLPECLPFIMEVWGKRNIPSKNELLPLVIAFQSWFLESRGERVSFACAFGFHATLTSVLILQGESHLSRIEQLGKLAYQNFFDQVRAVSDSQVLTDAKSKQCLRTVFEAEDLSKCSDDNPIGDNSVGEHALWNPVCSSMLLGYATFSLSLEAGSSLLNNSSQTTIVLHLFNALKDQGFLSGDLPVISTIVRHFAPVKKVFNGWEKPAQGQYVYRFHLSLGFCHKLAKYRQTLFEVNFRGGGKPEKPKTSFAEAKRSSRNRTEECINPGTFCKSYRMNRLHDFHPSGADDNELPGHLKMDGSTKNGRIIDEETTKFYRLMYGLKQDGPLLSLNMIAVAGIFNELVLTLFPPQTMNESSGSVPPSIRDRLRRLDDSDDISRVLETFSHVEVVLGMLDYHSDGPSLGENTDYLTELASKFESFFEHLDPARVVMWQ